jgi:glycosyltransferase involved in cell wall biosynthesis
MQNPESTRGGPTPAIAAPCITAIVPARNEEAVIETCVRSLAAQPEIAEIIVVDDQSTDQTLEILRLLANEIPHLCVIQSSAPQAGWLGKNNAVWEGAQKATGQWLLFSDADAELLPGAAAGASRIAAEHGAALVSFSPEQITRTWYEKALIPYVYSRLAKHFSYDAVNDGGSKAAAANGQFLMIRADAYRAIGGHEAVASNVLEDVALAQRAKAVGYHLWFGPGKGLVRVRMYRSFPEMWQGWRKNLYLLVGGTPEAVYRELFFAVPWAWVLLLAVGAMLPYVLVVLLGFMVARHAAYGLNLVRNQYPAIFILYYVPAVILYAGVLWASYRAHARGYVEWKGRQVSVGAKAMGAKAT